MARYGWRGICLWLSTNNLLKYHIGHNFLLLLKTSHISQYVTIMAFVQPIPDEELYAKAGREDQVMDTWAWQTHPGDPYKPGFPVCKAVKVHPMNSRTWRLHRMGPTKERRWLGQIRIGLKNIEDFRKIDRITLESNGSTIATLDGESAYVLSALQGTCDIETCTIGVFHGIVNNHRPLFLSNLSGCNIDIYMPHNLSYCPQVEYDCWFGLGISGESTRKITTYFGEKNCKRDTRLNMNHPTSHMIFWFNGWHDAFDNLTLFLDGKEFGPFNSKTLKKELPGTEQYVYVLKFGEDNQLETYGPNTKTLNFSNVYDVKIKMTGQINDLPFKYVTTCLNILWDTPDGMLSLGFSS